LLSFTEYRFQKHNTDSTENVVRTIILLGFVYHSTTAAGVNAWHQVLEAAGLVNGEE